MKRGKDATPLPYAPRAPWHRSAWARLAATWLAIGVLAAAALLWMPRALRHVEFYRLQRQCLDHTPPESVAALEASKPDPSVIPPARKVRRYTFRAWEQYLSTAGLDGPSEAAVVFVGRIGARESERLVGVQAKVSDSAVVFDVAWMAPGGLLEGAPREHEWSRYPVSLPRPGAAVRVGFGRRDPGNPRHFMIDWESEGQQFRIDGWLSEDGRHVTLTSR